MEKNMKKCKACGEQIAKTAKNCPKCGAKNSSPIFKKWWFWVIIAVFIIAISSGGSDESKTTNVENSKNGSVMTQETEQQNNTEEKEEIYKIGDVVTVGDFEYTVLEVSDTKSLGSNPYLKKETENNYIVVKVTVKNIGSEAKTIYTDMFELKDDNDIAYESDGTLGLYVNEGGDGFLLEELNPNISRTGYVVFETPITNLEAQFDLRVTGGVISAQQKIISLVQ